MCECNILVCLNVGGTIFFLDWFVSHSLADESKGRPRGKGTGGAEVSSLFPMSGLKSGASEQVRQYCFTLMRWVYV